MSRPYTISNLDQAVQVLREFMPKAVQSVNWSFALEDMKALMAELGNPQDKLKVIHVAGTSGKTSTSYYIAEMLRRSGKTVGLTVSPHVDTVNERVQINGQALPEPEFCSLLQEFLTIPAVLAAQPTYFGLLAAFAYWVFALKKVDYAVVEVGLGGRWDATNVATREDKVCVITDIGLDHVEMLGNNVKSIAFEKAGIIHADNQVLTSPQPKDIIAIFEARAREVEAKVTVIEQIKAPTELPLFQQRNWNLARAAVLFVAQRDRIAIKERQLRDSASIIVPARMEKFRVGAKTVIVDGAHNAQKMTALCQSLQQQYPNQKVAVVVSFVHDKGEAMTQKMTALSTVASHLIVTTFRVDQDVPKWSTEPAVIKQVAEDVNFHSVEIIPNPTQAFEALMKRPEPVVLVTGSFYLLNQIRPLIVKVAA